MNGGDPVTDAFGGGGLAEIVPEPLDRILDRVLGEDRAARNAEASNRPWSVRKRQMLLFFALKLQRITCDDRNIAASVLREVRSAGGFASVEDLIDRVRDVSRELAPIIYRHEREAGA